MGDRGRRAQQGAPHRDEPRRAFGEAHRVYGIVRLARSEADRRSDEIPEDDPEHQQQTQQWTADKHR